MRDWTVHLLRGHITQYITHRLRIYISMLPDAEPEVHERLTGPEGVKTIARIVDVVLAELGHPPPASEGKSYDERKSVKAARKAL